MPVRILVADDHQVVRTGLRALLESRTGWQVCAEAANGREAVEKAGQLKPECGSARHRYATLEWSRGHSTDSQTLSTHGSPYTNHARLRSVGPGGSGSRRQWLYFEGRR